jgi:release factor glutamine methyltransferase
MLKEVWTGRINLFQLSTETSLMEPVYKPSDDSYLLQAWVEKLVTGRVLDMGTGSGIQGVTAAKKRGVNHVTSVDVNPAALVAAERKAAEEGVLGKMAFMLSNLFQSVNECFDWIIFNPPYLPSEGEPDELSWSGGPTGREIIRRFLYEAPRHLNEGGSILMVYSSLTGLTEKDFEKYRVEILEERPLFYETLICVKLTPS